VGIGLAHALLAVRLVIAIRRRANSSTKTAPVE
jgi:hypothetical protein